MTKLLLGADPEFFVTNGNKIVPAVGMVAGDKYNPLACLRGAMQVDGLALEFNIDPASTLKEWELNLKSVMRRTLMEARKTTKDNSLKISTDVMHTFNRDEFDKLPDDSKRLGCSISFNEWGPCRIPDGADSTPKRVVGGHVHLGWTEDANTSEGSVHFRDCARLGRWLDIFVQYRLSEHFKNTLTPAAFDKMCKQEALRKNTYGQYGEFRCKSYGMEYRSLSNIWIHNEETRALVYNWTQEAFELAVKYPEIVEAVFYRRAAPSGMKRWKVGDAVETLNTEYVLDHVHYMWHRNDYRKFSNPVGFFVKRMTEGELCSK